MIDLFQRSAWADPFRDLRRLQQEVNRMFGGWAEGRGRDFPALNLWAGEDGVVVSAELPGVVPDDVKIVVHKNALTLSGERPATLPGAEAVALRRELPSGHFTRTITLPFVVDADKVEAHSEAGVLVIHLPRPAAERPKRIPITSA